MDKVFLYDSKCQTFGGVRMSARLTYFQRMKLRKESSARKLVLKNNKILLSLLLFPARENQYKKKPQNRRGGIHMITEVLFDC